MEREDDPEARIRELERSLADTPRASEVGGTQTPGGYPYPSGPPVAPPPPFSYGGQFPGTSPRPPTGNRVWWVLAAFFVIGMVALAGGVAAYSAHRLSSGGLVTSSPTPTISTSSPAPSVTGTQTPSAGPSTSPTSGPIPPPGGNLSVSGISENQTITCNESTVSVNGMSNRVVISGHCTSLTVSGVQNSVTVDAVDTIEADGFNNKVTYHTGSPSISKSGDSNVVQQG
jgi:Protein of unknown function (DUF3060)